MKARESVPRRSHATKLSASTVIEGTRDPFPSTDRKNGYEASFVGVEFSHIHLYVDHIEDLDVYKKIEEDLNAFASDLSENENGDYNGSPLDTDLYEKTWKDRCGESETKEDFIPQRRDIVKQLIAGLGLRVTGECNVNNHTKNLLVTTKDPDGVQFVVSALDNGGDDEDENSVPCAYSHFNAKNIRQFYDNNADRQGIAVLAFEVTSGDIQSLYESYQKLHPHLITEECHSGPLTYSGSVDSAADIKVLEVYSYYKNDKNGEVDRGTKLRFVQNKHAASSPHQYTYLPLPGFQPLSATYDHTCMAAYCDHWVSNVVSRTGFIETLEETLGFTPKVDFNAGVVAAGEAQIESTVTGNDSTFVTQNRDEALKDQSQVYLPINNALSEVGHVHGFLEELGQGIQHVASRVDDLPKFVQRGNDFRRITGEGFTFLNIPRSYYGVCSTQFLEAQVKGGLSEECSRAVMGCCEKSNFMSLDGAIDLTITTDEVSQYLDETIEDDMNEDSDDARREFQNKKNLIVDAILRSRYINLVNLLGDALSEEKYLSIVRNKILVDVQGDDLLFQIFTSNILQRNAGDESPFLEFIQRVCSVCSSDDSRPVIMKAGCGGFGIRNFLTLFLSIEVGKAMLEVSRAKAANDYNAMSYAQRKVDTFTDQLNEANPILTEISDAMTEEGLALDGMKDALDRGDEAAIEAFRERKERASIAKAASNEKLMACSSKYNELMKELRLESKK